MLIQDTIPAFKELDDALTEFSEKLSLENRLNYENAKHFYRGTSVLEMEDVIRRGGGISTGGRFEFTSLTTNLKVADEFAEKENHVIIVYDGDSVRRTGAAVPVKYSHKYSTRDEEIERGMSLAYMGEDETRIPDGTEGPVLTDAVLDSKKPLLPRMVRAIKKAEKAGIRVSSM